ncbi:MAG: hypothetical protein A3I00_00400 [Betaproteobacteria bacterium RIFCSPLOWO2_02_FULL_64_12]|nr:MAG: hypothetical protein A3I00_00400 [Betaproteobacteria bacterium RIFCSPLOWO2_02_FULL_64_12]
MRAWVLALVGAALPLGNVLAHKPSDSYLALKIENTRIAGQWDIALRDLEYAIGLDANSDGQITWAELKARHADIASYALARLAIIGDSRPCIIRPTAHLVDEHSDGAYEVLRFEAECEDAAESLEIRYNLFFDLDATHKGLLRLEVPQGTLTGVFSQERPAQRFELKHASSLAQFLSFGREGVWHIWIGIDHVLFIISLLLPSVLVIGTGPSRWEPARAFAPAFWDVFKVVTSFTVAHSITLSLAALSVISLPSRLVESTIAASVALAALNNLWPVVTSRRWVVAFAFGLIHGFGFASVLTDLGLPRGSLLLALVGFNLGVEVGQLAIVSAFLPLAFMLRASWLYRRLLMTGGSLVVAAIALVWLVERALNVKLLSA